MTSRGHLNPRRRGIGPSPSSRRHWTQVSLLPLPSLQSLTRSLFLPGTSNSIKQVAQSAMKSNNPQRILKSVLDLMSERYVARCYEPLSLEEILTAIEITELRTDTRQQLYEVNAKTSHWLYIIGSAVMINMVTSVLGEAVIGTSFFCRHWRAIWKFTSTQRPTNFSSR